MKSFRKLKWNQNSGARLILGLAILTGFFAFQNCGKGFETISADSHTLSSISAVKQCSPTQSQACLSGNGSGIQFCDASGVPQTCAIESCNSGFVLQNGACAPMLCTAGAIAACAGNFGTGNKTCNSQGTGFGACVLNMCNTGYVFQPGSMTCLPSCVAKSTTSCTENNGVGMHTCNDTGTAYGACVLSSCNAGYNLQNGSCVANSCTPGAKTACSENNGQGEKICNSTGTGYGACTITTCSAGYNLQNTVCVANACTPNTGVLACTANNGTGTQTCNSTGTGYQACVITACNSGFHFQGSVCVANVCTPGAKQACSFANGTGTQTCAADGSGFGACAVASCNTGYDNQGGLCVRNANYFTYEDLKMGTWTIACQPGNNYMGYQSRFIDGEVEVNWRYYATDCTTLMFQDYQRQHISEVVSTYSSTGTDFTWRYDRLEDGFHPDNSAGALYMNQNALCNKTNWVVGSPFYRQVAPFCFGLTTQYWRVRMESSGTTVNLFAADTNTGSGQTADTRPTGVNRAPGYVRQINRNAIIPNPQTSGSLRP